MRRPTDMRLKLKSFGYGERCLAKLIDGCIMIIDNNCPGQRRRRKKRRKNPEKNEPRESGYPLAPPLSRERHNNRNISRRMVDRSRKNLNIQIAPSETGRLRRKPNQSAVHNVPYISRGTRLDSSQRHPNSPLRTLPPPLSLTIPETLRSRRISHLGSTISLETNVSDLSASVKNP